MNAAAQLRERGAQAVRLLLPVWGARYLRRFFEFSLPTMIAPGNIPALAAALPCTFVFLTSAQDAELIAEHPGYRHLSAICRTEIVPIDDLITGDNHSTTITLAYERAMRAAAADHRHLLPVPDLRLPGGGRVVPPRARAHSGGRERRAGGQFPGDRGGCGARLSFDLRQRRHGAHAGPARARRLGAAAHLIRSPPPTR